MKYLMKIFLFFVMCIAKVYAASLSPNQLRFLTMADIHFYPFHYCGTMKPCPLIEKLRNASAEQWPAIFNQFKMSAQQNKQDTNSRLLISALNAARDAVNVQHAQFVLILGDSLGHHYRADYRQFTGDRSREGYKAFARKTLVYLSQQIAATFPTIDVYTLVGNNDSYKGNYITSTDNGFFIDAAVIWSSLVKSSANREAMRNQFSHAGYYSVLLSSSLNLRLLALNTVPFSYKAKGKNLENITNAEFVWLHAQLQAAKDKNEKVFIAMHIPEAIDIYATQRLRLFRLFDLWKTTDIQRFQAEIKAYAPQIVGIFAGHLHSNWVQFLTIDGHEIPQIVTTSISPVFGNYPAFRIYSYSEDPFKLQGLTDYSYSYSRNAWKSSYSAI